MESSEGRIGSVVDQVLLYCYHYEPATGTYSLVAMNAVRLGGAVTVALLLGFVGMSLRREQPRRCRALTTLMGGIPLFPEQASTFAAEVDALYIFIVAVSAFFTVAVSAAVLFFAVKYRRRHPEEVGAHIEGSLPLELAWSIIPTIISMVMFAWGAKLYYEMRRPPAEAHADLRRRQAVDVEIPAHRRTARDQRTARPDRTADQGARHVRGRPPRPLLSGIPHQDRRHPRPLHAAVVRSHQAWPLPHLLRRILRNEAFRHDRHGRGDGAGAVPGVAGGRRLRRHHGGARRQALPGSRLQQLPSRQRPGPRAVAEGHHRHAGRAGRRRHGARRRSLPARVDPELAGQGRARLHAADADLPGPHQRRRPRRPHRAHQVAVATGDHDRAGAGAGCGADHHVHPPRRHQARESKPWIRLSTQRTTTCRTGTA